MATYMKLKDGSWGVRVDGTAQAGVVVTVRTKAGAVKTETIAAVLWSGPDRQSGRTVSVCSIEPTFRRTSGEASRRSKDPFAPVRGCADCSRLGRMCKQCQFDEYDC